jgi:hypothetical protein
MMHYVNRNGVTEQVRFFRQQPRNLASLPFDFEEERQARRTAFLDSVVFAVCAMGLVLMYALTLMGVF